MNTIPVGPRHTLLVICAPHAARESISSITAKLALRNPLTVLDGGNRFQPYKVAQFLRRYTPSFEDAASHLLIQRAFTCYQMLALLENAPALGQPTLILDLLATFFDDHVQERDARHLLKSCLRQIERLRRSAPVVVTLSSAQREERSFLIEMVCAEAENVMVAGISQQQEAQLSLFNF